MRRVVTIAKNLGADDCYHVRVFDADTNTVLHRGGTYLWGTFDDGSCSWQKARAMAEQEARRLAKQYNCAIER